MSTAQHRFSDYLQCEIYHSLGAYDVAEQKLGELAKRLEKAHKESGKETGKKRSAGNVLEQKDLLQLTQIVRDYNRELGSSRHASDLNERHPFPKEMPLSLAGRFSVDSPKLKKNDKRGNPWGGPLTWVWVPRFYDAAIHVLDPEGKHGQKKTTSEPKKKNDAKWVAHKFTTNLIAPRDGHSNLPEEQVQRQRRLDRFKDRRDRAYSDLSYGNAKKTPAAAKQTESETHNVMDFVHSIATDNLGTAGPGSSSLPLFVLNALVEAHLCMHAVEAWQSMSLGATAKLESRRRPDLKRELDRSIALNTFAYCVSRSAPWIFAENDTECRKVFADLQCSWKHAVPTRCMWIAWQTSLLALYRRAYARSLAKDRIAAFNDYHKLQRHIRHIQRLVESAPLHVDGALQFLTALNAQAHHHIGELYRAEHAQQPALKHFSAAIHSLDLLHEDDKMNKVLTNSRWYVQLQVSRGKACYEMGRHKESLCWHLRGWRAFLKLLAADTHTEVSIEKLDEAIKWLGEARFEPELLKNEVQAHLRPIIDQFEGITIDARLGELAADILLRLGHLLFVLNMPTPSAKMPDDSAHPDREERRRTKQQIADEAVKSTLAFDCLRKAAECDPHGTLIGADLLKVRARFRVRTGGRLREPYDKRLKLPKITTVAEQWPGGGDDYEQLARVTEYLMLSALDKQSEPSKKSRENPGNTKRENEAIARRLLLNFFTHTDSINVRKSQAHHFLMREGKDDSPAGQLPPTIEFICMRRYSSSFPLLPRPSAFRALGGGYFVRLHPNGENKHAPKKKGEQRPFGIVIDPGVDFVENLYRTGCSLSDVDMVIVTHDHVDHMGSLDPLLTLLFERTWILKKQKDKHSSDKLPILANKSVIRRYRKVTIIKKAHEFISFDEVIKDQRRLHSIKNFPRMFKILAMSTKYFDKDKEGHRDLSLRPSYGLCFRASKGPSLAITGDSPKPPRPRDRRYKRWRSIWEPALTADVLIAHLSTIPLTELRQLAALDATLGHPRAATVTEMKKQNKSLRAAAKPLVQADGLKHFKHIKRGVTRTSQLADQLVKMAGRKSTDPERFSAKAQQLEKRARRLSNDTKSWAGGHPGNSEFEQFALDARRLAFLAQSFTTDSTELNQIRAQLEQAASALKGSASALRGRVEFAFWLRSHDKGPTADLIGKVSPRWQTPQYHAYLGGMLTWAREYREARDKQSGLFILGELSDELGTVRGQVATRLNETIFGAAHYPKKLDELMRAHALTSDIALRVLVCNETKSQPNARVLCTTCDLDTDRVRAERYHVPHDIHQVCVKGENEGIFYNCTEHDPASQENPAFLEQLERFDVFGR